jgi:hypothetical protein
VSFVDPVVAPFPYEVRASWGDVPLARSSAAMRVDSVDRPPVICVPWDDVDPSALSLGGTEAWMGGEVERWDAEGPVPEREGVVAWGGQPAAEDHGRGVVGWWLWGPPGLVAGAGHAVVDQDRGLLVFV